MSKLRIRRRGLGKVALPSTNATIWGIHLYLEKACGVGDLKGKTVRTRASAREANENFILLKIVF